MQPRLPISGRITPVSLACGPLRPFLYLLTTYFSIYSLRVSLYGPCYVVNFPATSCDNLPLAHAGMSFSSPDIASEGRLSRAAAVALTTSVINILILTLLHGQQLGWLCLGSCGIDVTVNAMVIFAVSHSNDGSHTDVESPCAPISSEKYVIASPRVTVFKGTKETPNTNESSFKNQTFSADFALTCGESDTSTATFSGAKPYNKAEMFDYLPKDQIPTMEDDNTVMISASERSEADVSGRELSGSTVQQSMSPSVQDGGRNSFINHECGRSRGLLADFYDKIGRNRHVTEDVAIQVSDAAPRYAPL
jgi:hypothetical protein